MGRRRTINTHLPQFVVYKNGAYYHVRKRGGRARWTHLGHDERAALVSYRGIETMAGADPCRVPDDRCELVIRPRDPPPAAKKWIYVLTASDDDEIRYVGQTQRPYERLKNHVADPMSGLAQWFGELRERGAEPVMKLLYQVPTPIADFAETEAIRRYRNVGARLFNRETVTNRGTWSP